MPCPHCGEHQTLELENLRWPEGRPREAEYACTHCGALVGERHKTWMLEHGAWRPTAEGDGWTAGFHLSRLYSPVGWFSWADAAEMYEQAQKAPDLMKGFVNTVLGLPFEEQAEAPEWQRLYKRRETWRIGTVPELGLFLTAGVDVQKDRIEVEVVAWGRRKESWSVDYRVIEGDTARAEVWAKLDALLAKDWPHASGHSLPIRVMCVDAGYATQDVYAWVRRHAQASWGPAGAAARQPGTAVAVKGRDQDTALLLSVSEADAGGKRRGLRVWSVGTPVAQGALYRWLKLESPTEAALNEGSSYPAVRRGVLQAAHRRAAGDPHRQGLPARLLGEGAGAGARESPLIGGGLPEEPCGQGPRPRRDFSMKRGDRAKGCVRARARGSDRPPARAAAPRAWRTRCAGDF